VIEAQERVGADGEVVEPLDEEHLRERLWAAYDAGLRSVAIVFMHGYRFARTSRRRRAGAPRLHAGQHLAPPAR
jgi:N-methylhydantoinase A/oxoprolinase/acetone carboxylase beta subunit